MSTYDAFVSKMREMIDTNGEAVFLERAPAILASIRAAHEESHVIYRNGVRSPVDVHVVSGYLREKFNTFDSTTIPPGTLANQFWFFVPEAPGKPACHKVMWLIYQTIKAFDTVNPHALDLRHLLSMVLIEPGYCTVASSIRAIDPRKGSVRDLPEHLITDDVMRDGALHTRLINFIEQYYVKAHR